MAILFIKLLFVGVSVYLADHTPFTEAQKRFLRPASALSALLLCEITEAYFLYERPKTPIIIKSIVYPGSPDIMPGDNTMLGTETNRNIYPTSPDSDH